MPINYDGERYFHGGLSYSNKVTLTDEAGLPYGSTEKPMKVENVSPPQVIYVQGTAALTWTIDHNLNRYPQVTTLDSTGAQISGTVTWPTLNRVVITFSPAVAGKAFLT